MIRVQLRGKKPIWFEVTGPVRKLLISRRQHENTWTAKLERKPPNVVSEGPPQNPDETLHTSPMTVNKLEQTRSIMRHGQNIYLLSSRMSGPYLSYTVRRSGFGIPFAS